MNRLWSLTRLAAFAVCLLVCAACNALFMDEHPPDTPASNFNLLWQVVDEHYCFFAEKRVDWGQVYDDYYGRMLTDGDDAKSPQLFHTMGLMLNELQDGHVSISDGMQTLSYTGWYDRWPDNYRHELVDAIRTSDNRTRWLNNETSLSILPEQIGYIRCPTFVDKFNRDDLDRAMMRFEGARGVIIDVRNNGGGLVSEAYMLASRFADKKTHTGYIRYKTGSGHDAFSDYYARYVEPAGSCPFHGKVAVITNRKVYSAANLFVALMACLPQVRIIGDHTGGGGGIPISAELYNGWTLMMSVNATFDVQKKSIEQGIAPDQNVGIEKDAHKDHMIEAAKIWILQKQESLR